MKHIKTHKINTVHLRPGDSIALDYSYEEPAGTWNRRYLTLDSVEEPLIVDTVIVYKTEAGEHGLKAGRVLVMGEDDGTHKDIPINPGMMPLINQRLQKV